LLEIRADNLRFSREEAQIYLEEALEEELDPKMVARLEERTEGWITGLRLAALSLRGQDDLKILVDAFGGSSTRYVRDYLFDEVLSRQTQAAQDFLLGTSILDRFCAELCDAVIGESVPTTSRDLLAQLESNRLFLVPLDLEHSWYRYHHLFQDVLRHRLARAYSQEEINELHSRASAWFSKKGWIEDALRHALTAEDMEGAAQLVEDSRHDLLNAEEWPTLERLLNSLPEKVVQERPALLVARSWVLELRFQLAGIPSLLQEAVTLLSASDAAMTESDVLNVRGEIDALMSLVYYLNDEGQRALESALSALEGINIEHAYVRSFAIIIQALAYQKTGQSSTALGVLSAYLAKTNTQFKTIIARVLIGQAYIHMLHGNLHQAEQVLNRLQQVGNTARLTISMVVAHWLLGRINYEWSRFETAEKHFSAVFELRYGGQFVMVHDSMMALALINQVQGMPEKRDEALAALRRFALESGNTERLHEIDSLEAHLALLRGDLGIAIRWAETAHFDIPTGVFLFLEVPIISKARILIAQGTNTSLQEATRLLKELLANVEAMHNTYRLIGLLADLALAYQAKGQTENALEVLEHSVKLAQPGGFIRTYVDMGPRMAGLLKQLTDHDIATDYIRRVLAAYSEAPTMGEQLNPRDTRAMGELPGLLTRREYEVLTLQGQWLSNKEIAQELVISPRTVKKHTSNIYRKLEVNNRMRAIEKAKELGLL
jgi:LuxR family maltose regulon positive regulatory protein